MKVLFFTRKYPPAIGGMEQQSYNLTQTIGCGKKIVSWGGSQLWLPFIMVKFFIVALFNTSKYDLIHLNDAVLSNLGWVVKKVFKKPVAVNLHGLDITYSKWGYQTYLKIFGKKFDLYICNSTNTKRLAEKHGFINTVVIPNGFTTLPPMPKSFEDKSLESLNTKGNVIYILTVGRLVARKGVAWFIENVFIKLPKNVQYLIVGDGKEKNSIRHFITVNNLADRIKLLGRVSDNDLERIYHLADIFVMPNIKVKDDVEGFGIVALEAAIRGIPVVAADIDGISDAIKNNVNGIIVESKNSNEFRLRIFGLVNNLEERDILKERAHEYTLKNFNWNRISSLYIDQFKKVVSLNGKNSHK